MTTNAYLFMWDQLGIESIVPISEYEQVEVDNTMRLLKDERPVRNPLWSVIQTMVLRAKFNQQRHYEIYTIDCAVGISKEDWKNIWENDPQGTADLIRERGQKLYSDREQPSKRVIV